MIGIKRCTLPAALRPAAGLPGAGSRGNAQERSVGGRRRRVGSTSYLWIKPQCAATDNSGGEEDAHAAVPLEAGEYPSQTPMGKGADEVLGGEPAGSLNPSTEAVVKKDLQQAALDSSQDRQSSSGRDSSVVPGPSLGAEDEGQRGSAAPPSSMQLALGAVGLAALPIVAWSEWVLKSTGCGLPPGPSGLLGAAEGISYLVVGGIVVWSLARKLRTGNGLPSGPAGLLGAVEGGSWLAALSGLVVLGLQWQAYGYIPSALPDSNCFGQSGAASVPSFTTAQAQPGTSNQHLASIAASLDSHQDAQVYSNVLRVNAAGGSFPVGLPQGNLIFSLEAALSQSGAIAETAETAAAAVTAAAAGQPPPAQVQAAVQHLQHRAMQAQQLAAALRHRLIALGGIGDIDQALTAALSQSNAADKAVAAPAPPPAPPAPEPLRFEPPRHKVRAALRSSWTALLHSDKVQALLAPMPLPAVSRHAAELAAAGAAQEAAESIRVAPVHSDKVVASMGRKAISTAISTVKHASSQAAAQLPPPLRHLVPKGVAAAPQQAAPPAAAAAAAAAPAGKPAKPSSPAAPASSGGTLAAKAPSTGSPAGGAAASKGKEAAADSKNVQAVTVGMFSSALDDLGEGFVGLWESAKTFDPTTTAAVLKERMHQQMPPPPAPAPAPAPATATAAATASAAPAPVAGTSTSAKAALKTK